jgi:dihydrodipicolinate synthase/N-acetylneuraminate lyase
LLPLITAIKSALEHLMSLAHLGLLIGMALGFAGYFGGFAAFLLVLALGAVGFVAGRLMESDVDMGDLGDLLRNRDRRR